MMYAVKIVNKRPRNLLNEIQNGLYSRCSYNTLQIMLKPTLKFCLFPVLVLRIFGSLQLSFSDSVCLSTVFFQNASFPAVLDERHKLIFYYNVLLCEMSMWSSRIVDPDLMTSVMTSWNLASRKFQTMISLERVGQSTSCLTLGAYCQQRANHIASHLPLYYQLLLNVRVNRRVIRLGQREVMTMLSV